MVEKIVKVLEKRIDLERVQEHRVVFFTDNEEFAQLVFSDKDSHDEEVSEGLLHEHELRFLVARKMSDDSGLKLEWLTYVETDKDIEFFVNQILEFISMDEKEVSNFKFKYSEV